MVPKVSVVTVSWNVRDLLRENLAQLSVYAKTFPLEVIVVDNDSHDGTRDMVRTEFPEVRLLVNGYNAGFGAACNRGARVATGETVLFLNPDMRVAPGALERAYKELMDRPDVGLVGAKLVAKDGTPIHSVRRDPAFGDQFATLLKVGKFFPSVLNRYLAKDFDYGHAQDVEQVRGSFMLLRRSFGEEIGWFDERYYIWFEDVDLCRRVRHLGKRVRYVAEAEAHDAVGQSFKQQPLLWKQRQFSRSMATYFSRWEPSWQGLAIRAARPFVLAGAWLHDLLFV